MQNRINHNVGMIGIGIACLGTTLYLNFFQVCNGKEEITNWADGKEHDPSYEIGYDGAGKVVKSGQYQKEIDDPAKARKLDPKHAAKAYNNRGFIYRMMGQDKKAVEDLTKALLLDPSYTKAFYNRVWAYQDLGQWQKAIDDCNKLIELDPSCALFYYHRALGYGGLEQWQKAVDDCTKAIERNSRFAAAYMYRGLAYEKLGKTGLAEKDRAIGIPLGRAEQ